MGAAYFYHLTRRPLAETLMMLLTKSLANEWKVAVVGTDAQGLAALDQALWLGPEDGFLPHGLDGSGFEAEQPVLLTTSDTPANQPNCVMSVQGADVAPAQVERLDRVCVIFDGSDEVAVAQARTQWKRLKEAGQSAQYWSEETGRWEMKAQI